MPCLVFLAFWILGFVGSMASALVPALRVIYRLDFAAALSAQWVVLAVSGLLALPVVVVMRRLGMGGTVCAALMVIAGGCAMLACATTALPWAGVLTALAVIAAGTTALQVAGNPLAISLGPPEKAHARLALAQAFNSVGVLAGVHVGAAVMLGPAGSGTASLTAGLRHMYAINGALVVLALGLFALGLQRVPATGQAGDKVSIGEALASRWAWAGALAIALYCGAEGAIGAIMINFLHQPTVLGVPLVVAGRLCANLYWGGALAGRLAGSWLLTRVPAARLLALAALLAGGLCLIVATTSGAIAGTAALAIGLCNSIMFPTIFSLTLERSRAADTAVSGLLCTAIAGGAPVSMAFGALADRMGIATAFLVPMLAYAVVAGFALKRRRIRG